MLSDEERRQKCLALIPKFCMMDDIFLKAVLEGNKDVAEEILNVVLKKKLKILKVEAQKEINSILGRSIKLDIYAVDSNNKRYNIEVQNESSGAIPERARFNLSMMDSIFLDKGDDFSDLPESYVIFFTKHDVLKGNLAIYHIERKITELDNKPFNDRQHIIYINCSYKGNDDLGKLIADFKCTEPDKMNYPALAKRINYLKNNEKGQVVMCKLVEDLFNELKEDFIEEGLIQGFTKGEAEGRAKGEAEGFMKGEAKGRAEGIAEGEIKGFAKANRETAARLLKYSKMSMPEISSMADISLNEVEAIAKELNLA